jgi:hypothetical protein
MIAFDREPSKWDCPVCRRYRRLALVFTLAAACAWVLL